MLPISLNYIQLPISRNPDSQVMSIKIKYLCLSHGKQLDWAHLWMTTGRKKLTHSLQRQTRTRKCLTLLPPLLVWKEPEFSPRQDGSLGRVYHLLHLPTFWIKSLFLGPTTHLSMYQPVIRQAVWAWTQEQKDDRLSFTAPSWAPVGVSYSVGRMGVVLEGMITL